MQCSHGDMRMEQQTIEPHIRTEESVESSSLLSYVRCRFPSKPVLNAGVSHIANQCDIPDGYRTVPVKVLFIGLDKLEYRFHPP